MLVQHFWLFSRQTDGLLFKKNALDDFFMEGVRGEEQRRGRERATRQRGSVGLHLEGMFFKGTVRPEHAGNDHQT